MGATAVKPRTARAASHPESRFVGTLQRGVTGRAETAGKVEMAGARPSAPDPTSPPPAIRGSAIPVEQPGDGGWASRVVRTLIQLQFHPSASFRRCPEPVEHGRILRFLGTLRLPPWIVLLSLLGWQLVTRDGPEPIPTRSIHQVLEPPVAEALSTWLLLMVPVGLPLLYFFGGLFAHIGIALTGGAPRSIGATMRAVGLALGPALLAVALLDVPLYLGHMPGTVYVWVMAFVGVMFLVHVGIAVARTHQIALARGFLVALLPLFTLMGATLGRAALELEELPFVPPPASPYYVP